jgi:hypothetical protein
MGMTGDADRATMTGAPTASAPASELPTTTTTTAADAALNDPALPRIPGTSANPAERG